VGDAARRTGKYFPTVTVDLRDASSAAAGLGQLLLNAKFAVPQPDRGSVSRPGLVAAARSNSCILVAVTAPAGYGKSTFLAEWARAEDRRVAWVSLDRFDDDPAMLLVSLASGCCRAGLTGPDLVAYMGGPGASVLGRAALRLASALRASPGPFVLVLDDLHELRSPACGDVLSLVIAAIPPGSALVTSSRSEQPHLPRLRACDEALEIGAGDLALDAAGARQIFANAQVSITCEQASAVTEQTEGWPAGLHLAALIAKKCGGQAQTVSGEDRYVADYLYRETLVLQPEDTQRFLRRTAVLDQLCVPLCDAVLGSCGAAGQLRHLEAASLFVIPLDRRRQWYRYHALFREFLLGELRRAEPGIIMALHQRAADWYEASESPAAALEHLLHTTDLDRSMRLATALAQPAYKAGQISTVQRWLRVIGDANIERFPPLAVLKCWQVALTGDTAAAARWTAFLNASSFDDAPLDGSASFESARAMVRSAMCADGPETMMADAAFAVAQERDGSPWHAEALWLLGEARLLAGQLDEARVVLGEASAAAATTGNSDTAVICESVLAMLAMDRGRWQEAAGRLARALAVIDEHQMHDYAGCLLAFAEAARLAAHHGDLTEARRQLAQAMRSRPSATYLLPHLAVRLRRQLAKVCLAIAEVVAARQLLREIDDIVRHRPALGILTHQVEELRRALAASNGPGATGRSPLTPAELRLLPYLETHLTASGIAERLFVSSHTVKAEVKSIYRKLGVSSRDEAVRKATALGLLGVSDHPALSQRSRSRALRASPEIG
jgi:LuxR family maltose regulon positive regulatory protein